MSPSQVLLFEDHGEDWLDAFKLLLDQPSRSFNPLFLEQVARLLRYEVLRDPCFATTSYWNFVTLHELYEQIRSSGEDVPYAIQTALTCITQIGLYFSLLNHGSENPLRDQSVRLHGYGIGSLAAIAVASSQGAEELIDICKPLITISYSIGALAQKKYNDRFSQSQSPQGLPWATLSVPLKVSEARAVLHSVAQNDHLCIYNKTSDELDPHDRFTIAGPTTLVMQLKQQHDLPGLLHTSMPIGIPGWYQEADFALFNQAVQSFQTRHQYAPKRDFVFSGMKMQDTESTNLLRAVIESILSRPDDIADDYTILTAGTDSHAITVYVLRESQKSHQNISTLKSYGKTNIVLKDLSRSSGSSSQKPSSQNCPIAIVGMAGRFPGANDATELWELLCAGKDVHQTIPPDRYDAKTHTDPTGQRKNTSKTPYGCFVNNPGLFDQTFFNMSPREIMQTDPAQRLMIITAYEALEMSGFVPDRTPSSQADRVATFYGQASDDWREVNAAQNIGTYFIPGGVRAFGPGRINYHLKLSGPSFVVDTACSSSFGALHAACNSLWLGDCDTAIAGGANILTNPDIYAGLSRGHFLSQTGSCKTFDESADGYCRADAVASVILKRLDDAEADHDNILGVIAGIGTNHSAHAISITHPHAPTQTALYKSLLRNNNVSEYEVDYVEMHGTGTQAGDYNEMTSVSDVFAPRERKRETPLFVGSVKANVGHSEAAAGITSLIKVLMMLRHDKIPPHVGVKTTVNPAFPEDLQIRNLRIPFSSQAWKPPPDGHVRTAFLNNFSAAGGNTALILRDYTNSSSKQTADPRPAYVLAISAKTQRSMAKNAANVVKYINSHPSANISDLSYTLTARRVSYDYRRAVTVHNIRDARKRLEKIVQEKVKPVRATRSGIIFTFTGQGSLYASVAKSLFDICQSFRRDVVDFDQIAKASGYGSFLCLITGSVSDVKSLPAVVQHVGQVCIQLALAKLWMLWGMQPAAVTGHSLGEYVALAVAKVVTPAEMIYLVGERARLLDEHCQPHTNGMMAVNADSSVLADEIVGTTLEISCINGPNMSVLGGPLEDLDSMAQLLKSKGYRCIRLPTPHAYHTSQLDVILPYLELVAKQVSFSKPVVPVLSPLLKTRVEEDIFDATYLQRHTREPVDFRGMLVELNGQDGLIDDHIWLEIGPHPTCSTFISASLGSVPIISSLNRDKDSWESLSEGVCTLFNHGFNFNWTAYHQGFEACHRLIELPSYAWDTKNFWIDYSNDWCLSKGDVPPVTAVEVQPMISHSIHKILTESITEQEGSVTTETELSDPYLQSVARGHRVNGTSLCPSSLYADMVYTVAQYIFCKMQPDRTLPAFDIHSMSVDKTLIISTQPSSVLRVDAHATSDGIQLQIYTVDRKDETKRVSHAICEVRFGAADEWQKKWKKQLYIIQDRMAELELASTQGRAHRMQRSLVYRLFASFVDYDPGFQGIEEVIMNGPRFEATAKAVLKPIEKGANFRVPATWIDSLLHLTGVILNASDSTDPNEVVYISHGWRSLRLATTLQEGGTYRTYTKMQETDRGIMEGDVWILQDDQVVGLAKGLKFQQIPRRTIDVLLPKANQASRQGPAANAVPKQSTTIPKVEAKVEKKIEAKNLVEPSLAVSAESGSASKAFDDVLEVIASECYVDPKSLADDCTIASLGVDSLLSLDILAKLREMLQLDLRPEILQTSATIGEFKTRLKGLMGEPDATPVQTSKAVPRKTRSSSAGSSASNGSSIASVSNRGSLSSRYDDLSDVDQTPSAQTSTTSLLSLKTEPKSVSYLLSGNPKTASRFLFLFPDGSGSATSYVSLPPMGPDICVYALNCPYMTTPTAWTSGISEVTRAYLEEVKRRQPEGPYNLGGWSAGGTLAYDAASQLVASGNTVERLILIDSVCPIGLEQLPVKMFTFLDSVRLLGRGSEKGTPEWVIPHFEAAVWNLNKYKPQPFQDGKAPATTAIWARRGVLSATNGKEPLRSSDDPEVMDWLLNDRTEFGANGWDALLPSSSIKCEVMDGHHFAMINDHVEDLGKLMIKAMK